MTEHVAWLLWQVLLLVEKLLLGLALLIEGNLVCGALELKHDGVVRLRVEVLHPTVVALVDPAGQSRVALFVVRGTSIVDHDTFDLRRSLRPISQALNVTNLLLLQLTLAEICQEVVLLVSKQL